MGGLAYRRLARLKALVTDLLQGKKCCFCKKPFANPLKVTTHHINGDHFDNRPENKTPAHEDCHRSYHAKIVFHKKSPKRAKREIKREKGIGKIQVTA